MTFRNGFLLVLLMLCGFIIVGQLYVTIPLVADIADQFGIEPAQAALVGSAFGFAYAAGFLVFGPLSDRYGRKPILVLGLLAVAAATVLVSVATSFGLLLLARAIQGFAASSFPPAALSLTAEALPPQHRPFGISLMSFAFLAAAPLAQFFAVQSGDGLSVMMLELAPIYVLGALGLFFAVKHKAGKRRAQEEDGRFAGLFHNAGIAAAWCAAPTVLFGFVSFHAGAQALSVSLGADLQMLRLAGLPPLLLTFAAAPVTRRYGALVTAQIGLFLAASSFGLALSGGTSALLASSALLSSGVAFAIPGLIATIAQRATDANRGLALAIYTFSLFLGASLAPPAVYALAVSGGVPLWLFPACLLVLAAFGLAAIGKPSTAT
ncbi:MFS transporter [Pararhizobium sp.]|uniref:MFS transporter n=1 Tax=Pararhizobium sp. TaxID=1977563 RepID=UPI003BAAC062